MTSLGEQNWGGEPSGGALGRALAVVLVMGVTAGVYWPAIGHDFTNWDDTVVLLERSRVRSVAWGNLIDIWTRPEKGDYFPITETSYAIEFYFAGYDPRVYHATNLVLHVACTGLVFWLGTALGLGTLGAMGAAAVFGLHPMHVETAAWVADRKDLLACLFSLGALLSFIAHCRRGAKGFYILGLALGLAAMLSKASAVSLGACVFVVQMWELRVGVKRALIRSGPLLVAGLGFTVAVILMHRSIDNIETLGFTESSRSVMLPVYGFAFHLCKFLWPHPLIAVYDVGVLTWDRAATWGALGVTVGVIVAAWVGRRNKWVLLGAGLYATGIAPTLRYVSLGRMDVADRYMYFPSVGLCLLLGAGVAWLWGSRHRETGGVGETIAPSPLKGWATRRAGGRIAAVGGVAGLACVLGVMSSRQVMVWRDSGTLWRHCLRYNPRAAVGHLDLGVFLSQEGDKDGAIEHLMEALRLDPEYGAAHYNLGEVLVEEGRYDEAIEHCKRALEIQPHHPTALNNWGIALVRRGDVDAGIEKYREALEIQPGYADAHFNLAIGLYGQGWHEHAAHHFEEYAELMPAGTRAVRARLGLGMALAAQGKMEEAMSAYEAALALDPNDVGVHLEYGSFMYGEGELERAMFHARRAIALAPNRADGYNNLAAALAVQGQYADAIEQYRAALRIDGTNALAQQGLAWTLAKQKEAGAGPGR